MTMCEHDLKDLVGTADGIVCKACGKTFKSMAEVEKDRKPKPKKRRAKDE